MKTTHFNYDLWKAGKGKATVFTAHLTPHQKFDAACKALGIE